MLEPLADSLADLRHARDNLGKLLQIRLLGEDVALHIVLVGPEEDVELSCQEVAEPFALGLVPCP